MEGFQNLDCYEVLGVKRTATAAEIRSAYKKLVLTSHPDKNPGKSSEEFVKIQSAYDILKDDAKRADFDQDYERRKSQRTQQQQQWDGNAGRKAPTTPHPPKSYGRGRKPTKEMRNENKPYVGKTYDDPYVARCEDDDVYEYQDWEDDYHPTTYPERRPRFAKSPYRTRGRQRAVSPVINANANNSNNNRRKSFSFEEVFLSRSKSRSKSKSKKRNLKPQKESPTIISPKFEYVEVDEPQWYGGEKKRNRGMPYIRIPETELGDEDRLSSGPSPTYASPSSSYRPDSRPRARSRPRVQPLATPSVRVAPPPLRDSIPSRTYTYRTVAPGPIPLLSPPRVSRTVSVDSRNYYSSPSTRRYAYRATSNVTSALRGGGGIACTTRTTFVYY